MTDYNSEKHKRRSSLTIRRNKNIKRVVYGIMVLLILLAIGNHFWKAYQRELYQDKQAIMNVNKGTIFNTVELLDDYNDMMVNLIYDLPMDKSFERGLIAAYGWNDSLRDFIYDYDAYNIDRFDTSNYMENVKDILRAALSKEGALTDIEKEGLSNIIKANQAIIDDYYSIVSESRYDDYRQEVDYLYYYKGEMLYMITNSIEVHSEGLTFDFIDVERANYSQEDLVKYTTDELEDFAKIFYQFIFDHEGNLSVKSTDYIDSPEGSFLGNISYEADGFTESEVIYTDTQGYFSYSFDMDEYGIDEMDKLSDDEIVAIANDFISEFDQPLLVVFDYRISEIDNNSNYSMYDFQYVLKDKAYVDDDTRVSLTILEDGHIQSVSLSNPMLLTGDVTVKREPMTYDEVVGVLPSEVKVQELYYLAGDEVYYVLYEDYGVEFLAKIQGESGELLNINLADEYMMWWK